MSSPQGLPKPPLSDEQLLAMCLLMMGRSGPARKVTTLVDDPIQPHQTQTHTYKCSVCGISFRSHQALGGHMGSHRKPTSTAVPAGDAAIHECAICHKKFPTGMALGGHMSSHRKIPNGGHIGSNSGSRDGQSECPSEIKDGGGVGLEFDLNVMPEVDEEGDKEEEFERCIVGEKERLIVEEGNDYHQE